MRRTRRGWAYSPLGFLRRIVVSIYENQVMFLASALAFDALLAALPFCVLVLAALGYILHSMGGTLGDIHAVLDRFFPAHRSGVLMNSIFTTVWVGVAIWASTLSSTAWQPRSENVRTSVSPERAIAVGHLRLM